jgi:hypothetical protein
MKSRFLSVEAHHLVEIRVLMASPHRCATSIERRCFAMARSTGSIALPLTE